VRTAMGPYAADATEVLFDVSPRKVTDAAVPGAAPIKWVGESAFASVPHAQYLVMLNLDAKTVTFTEGADGKVHGVLDFILIVYDLKGKQIDAKLDRAALALEPEHFKKLLTDGMRFRFNLVLPLDGDEVIRFGVHDAMTDHIGTLELSANTILSSDTTGAQ